MLYTPQYLLFSCRMYLLNGKRSTDTNEKKISTECEHFISLYFILNQHIQLPGSALHPIFQKQSHLQV